MKTIKLACASFIVAEKDREVRYRLSWARISPPGLAALCTLT